MGMVARMNLIRIYRIGTSAWTSPSGLLRAIRAKKKILPVVHGEIDIPWQNAVLLAWMRLYDQYKISRRRSVGNLLFSAAFALVFVWPIVATKIIPEILISIYLLSILSMLVAMSQLMGSWRVPNVDVGKDFLTPVKRTALLPPIQAHRSILSDFRNYRPILPCILLVVAIFLNSVVIASPLHPAVVHSDTPRVIQSAELVVPGTRWTPRQRYYAEKAMAYFAMPSEEEIWVVRLNYSAKRIDFIEDAEDWQDWMDRRLQSIVRNVTEYVAGGMPAGATADEIIEALVEVFEDEEFLTQMETALREQFNSEYGDVIVLQGVQAECGHINIAEYMKYMKENQ
jgi:hypothetical protein